MRPEYLRSHIKELTDEARNIRADEEKQKRIASEMRLRNRLSEGGFTQEQIVRIMLKAQKKGLRPNKVGLIGNRNGLLWPPSSVNAGWIEDHDELYRGFHHHRVTVVRDASRAAHLAYGFLRGVPYRDMEERSRLVPVTSASRQMSPGFDGGYVTKLFAQVWKFVDKFGGRAAEAKSEQLQELARWIDEAFAHIASQQRNA